MPSPQVDWNAPFEALEVGQSFTTRGRTVTEADVVGFSALTGDWHPQHADEVWARSSIFGQRIAHGMLVVSFAVGLVPFDPERVVALRRVGDVVFKRPVALGETIHVQGRIADLKAVTAAAGLVMWTWSVVDSSGWTACRASVDVMWRRGDAGALPAAEEAA